MDDLPSDEEYERAQLAENAPWRLTRQTVADWIAERPELYRFGLDGPEDTYAFGLNMPQRPSSSCVYFLFDGGELLYVGKSDYPMDRFVAHWNAGRIPFTHVRWVDVPRDAAERLEAFYIAELDPPYNQRFHGGMDGWHEDIFEAICRYEVKNGRPPFPRVEHPPRVVVFDPKTGSYTPIRNSKGASQPCGTEAQSK